MQNTSILSVRRFALRRVILPTQANAIISFKHKMKESILASIIQALYLQRLTDSFTWIVTISDFRILELDLYSIPHTAD